MDQETLQAIKTVLDFVNDAEYLLESLDYTAEEWKEFDAAIEKLQGVIIEHSMSL